MRRLQERIAGCVRLRAAVAPGARIGRTAVRFARDERGETFVETLVSTLIIVLVFAFVANAIVTAARINAMVSDADASLDLSQAQPSGTVAVSVDGSTVNCSLYSVEEDDGETHYYYYEHE